MSERRVDVFSLIVGLTALAGAGLFLIDRSTSVQVDGGVAAAAVFTVLALAALGSAVAGLTRRLRGTAGPTDSDPAA